MSVHQAYTCAKHPCVYCYTTRTHTLHMHVIRSPMRRDTRATTVPQTSGVSVATLAFNGPPASHCLDDAVHASSASACLVSVNAYLSESTGPLNQSSLNANRGETNKQ